MGEGEGPALRQGIIILGNNLARPGDVEAVAPRVNDIADGLVAPMAEGMVASREQAARGQADGAGEGR